MKGYKTSRDYALLWELIQQGYRVPCANNPSHWLTISVINKYPYFGFSKIDNNKDVFISFCCEHNLEFIPPTTDLISKKSIGELIGKINDKLPNDEPSAFLFGFDFVMDDLKEFFNTETE